MSARAGLLVAWLLAAPTAAAQRPPVTVPPGGITSTTLLHGFDRAAPQALSLWAPRTVLGYDEIAQGYGGLHLTCSADPAHGRCPAADTGQGPIGPARIALEFREQRSGQRIEIGLTGALERVEWERTCSDDFWDKGIFPLWTSAHRDCHVTPAGTAATLTLDAAEAVQLVAGRWRGELHLDLRHVGGALIGRQVFVLEIAVSDIDRATIHLPAFGSVAPLVGLQLAYRPLPPPGSIGGSAVLDLCLYDGLGAHSPQLQLSARDPDPAVGAQPPAHFSVWHDGGGREPHDRLDYRLQLRYGGRDLALRNNEPVTLDGTDSAPLRAVTLPGMPYPVYCVPVPMTLHTPRVPAASKRQGGYRGVLILQMRLPTQRP